MATNEDERLQNELSLLQSMYPEQVTWDENKRELGYTFEQNSFKLRLPDSYLIDQLPEVLSANIGKKDAREQIRHTIVAQHRGEEILDSIISEFNELAASEQESETGAIDELKDPIAQAHSKATVIVWLHHLLNTNKRKLALSPESSAVSGLTKPGYPGVLIYSGPAAEVHEHVNTLKQQNWQAFQVRLESDEQWLFIHGSGVKEVEAMKDLVADVGERKPEFMEAMRMK